MSLNVLITAGSRRVPLVRAFQRAVRATGAGHVVVADVNPLSPAVYAADRSHPVPLSTDPMYLAAIAEICQVERIGLVVPTIDDELSAFAEQVGQFTDAGIRVAISPPGTTAICNDKHVTCRTLAARGVEAVETRLPAELPIDPQFPLFIKPRVGRGGVFAFPVRNARELEFFLDYVPDRTCVELKSLKLYIWSYRNVGAFHEAVTNRILDDVAGAIKPRFMRLTAKFYVRGGIFTTVVAETRKRGWRPQPKLDLTALPSQSSTR